MVVCQTPWRPTPRAEHGHRGCGALAFGVSVQCARVRRNGTRSLQLPCKARGGEGDLAKAVAEGRMITVEESTLRKALGAFFGVLFLWQAILVTSTGAATLDIAGSSYATLALLASNTVGFAGSGFLNL
eukprot:symbB.v1.2.024921.t1/scaffold2392.1/size80309/4